jgi:hypothetical protein
MADGEDQHVDAVAVVFFVVVTSPPTAASPSLTRQEGHAAAHYPADARELGLAHGIGLAAGEGLAHDGHRQVV